MPQIYYRRIEGKLGLSAKIASVNMVATRLNEEHRNNIMSGTTSDSPQTIDTFIAEFSPEVQELLQTIRKIVHEAAPDAQEAIKYGMPTFTQYGNLVHFAAYKNHIGFYPTPSGIDQFEQELAKYRTGKGTIQFPIGGPIPYDLIRKVVAYRVQENTKKAQEKAAKKKAKS